MRITALFIGLAKARVERIASSIEKVSEITLVTSRAGGSTGDLAGRNLSELISVTDAVFVDRDREDMELERLLGSIRECQTEMPIVLVYESEPDGKCFMLANKFECWLFSDSDHLERTLTPSELGEALAEVAEKRAVERRLFEISLSSGPCSTGV